LPPQDPKRREMHELLDSIDYKHRQKVIR